MESLLREVFQLLEAWRFVTAGYRQFLEELEGEARGPGIYLLDGKLVPPEKV